MEVPTSRSEADEVSVTPRGQGQNRDYSRGTGFPACQSQGSHYGRLESLPHKSLVWWLAVLPNGKWTSNKGGLKECLSICQRRGRLDPKPRRPRLDLASGRAQGVHAVTGP